MLNNTHLIDLGKNQIVGFKEHSPYGISPELLAAFPNYIPIPAPDYLPDFNLLNIHWISGFINSDGCFSLIVALDPNFKLGERVKLYIQITQHTNSLIVLNKIQEFFGFGQVYPRKDTLAADYKITSITNINKFIELFKPAKLLGAKALDYADFCKGINLINEKLHLTRSGLNKIKTIIKGMNSTRTKF